MAVPQLVEYRGNCHCGAFKFKLKIPELNEAHSCNCSICFKNGYLWTFPARAQFTVVEGDEDTTLKSYLFGKQMMAHKFCPTCGTSVMEVRMPHSTQVGAPSLGINLRTLVDVDVDSLLVHFFDGAAVLKPPYEGPEPVAAGVMAEGTTAYHGNCHCGAVAYTLVSPHKISKATFCNCSICSRDAALWIYPDTNTITFKGVDSGSATEYTFSERTTYHGFCKTCGVSVYERFAGSTYDGMTALQTALNVRTMNGINLVDLEIELSDAKSWPPAYDVWGTKGEAEEVEA